MNNGLTKNSRRTRNNGLIKEMGNSFLPVALLFISIIYISGCSRVEVAELGKEIIPAGEAVIIDDISDLLTHKLKRDYAGQKFLRDTHPKANACVHATFKVNQGIESSYQQGIFQAGASYPVWIRFSNAVEDVTSDYEKDFRGLAMKLSSIKGDRVSMLELSPETGKRALLNTGDENHTQDFLFLGHDAFFAADPKDFFDFFSMSFEKFSLTHPRGAWNIFKGSKRVVTPLDIEWNSVTAYALGNEKRSDGGYQQVVRYALNSCVENTGMQPSEEHKGYLSENLAKQLSGTGEGCLDFYIQRQLDAEANPVENALVAWDKEKSPLIKIAQIKIPAQVFTAPEQLDFCENLSFNPWHSLEAHKPLGGVNRARRVVMKDISDERLRQNGVERVEPTGYERFE